MAASTGVDEGRGTLFGFGLDCAEVFLDVMETGTSDAQLGGEGRGADTYSKRTQRTHATPLPLPSYTPH